MELSDDQKEVFNTIMDWYKNGKTNEISFGGPAGSGKTSIISFLRQYLGEKINCAFISYTGKASSVLRKKLSEQNNFIKYPNDYCGTAHSLIYEPVFDNETKEIIDWKLRNNLSYDIIFCDESSMITKEIYEDIQSFDVPIIWVGDHYQLPPISDNFNLMENPVIKLEKIHRVAEDNPIIKLSRTARDEGYIDYGYYGNHVAKVRSKDPLITKFIDNSGNFLDTAILCGFNNTRIKVNQRIRDRFGYSKQSHFPIQGERVICLRNNKSAIFCPIYNGTQGTMKHCSFENNFLNAEIDMDGEQNYYKGFISTNSFNEEKPEMNEPPISLTKSQQRLYKKDRFYLDYFDFGYCLSVHKSQGSEWNRVMLIEQPCSFWSGEKWNRWLYTAVTRSSNQLLIVR